MPPLHAEIHNAIESHKAWKQILNAAVATGKSSLDPAVVCLDDRCPFGRWLHGLNDGVKASPRWQCVSTVHAEFHQEAAKVLTLALGGQRSAA